VDLQHGRIVMLTIGFSNPELEFGKFEDLLHDDPTRNPKLAVVNGAQGGRDVDFWTDPSSITWQNVNKDLSANGLTPAQVQVAWVKMAEKFPYQDGVFPAHAQHLQSEIEDVARNLTTLYPNIRIAYLSTRTHAYTTSLMAVNPEPYAYETGFAVKWAIEDQINGVGNLNYNPANGTVVAPLLLWGPYLWATGSPRSDGFSWLESDVRSDKIHPSKSGETKAADQLLAFFKTDPTTTPWFLMPVNPGEGPTVIASASVSVGTAPLSVNFTASATDPHAKVTQYAWTYDDGDFSFNQNPTKTFDVPGVYIVHLTVSDSDGYTTLTTLTITVNAPSHPIPAVKMVVSPALISTTASVSEPRHPFEHKMLLDRLFESQLLLLASDEIGRASTSIPRTDASLPFAPRPNRNLPAMASTANNRGQAPILEQPEPHQPVRPHRFLPAALAEGMVSLAGDPFEG
jgi:PKD repeat protein